MQLVSQYPALPPPIELPLVGLPAHACPYLPGRTARDRALWAESMPAELYEKFMDRGFRRSGKLLYQPVCSGCRACVPIRVPVAGFRPHKSQRRCVRRNADLTIVAQPPQCTDEKFQLYQAYVRDWHGRADVDDRSGFQSFLYDSPLATTLEFEYRDPAGRLLAVGICDLCPASLSSVYFYFDPAASHRGLGTFGALREIEFAAGRGLPFYYLGYWIDGCGAMAYKQSFRPNQTLHGDGVWRAAG